MFCIDFPVLLNMCVLIFIMFYYLNMHELKYTHISYFHNTYFSLLPTMLNSVLTFIIIMLWFDTIWQFQVKLGQKMFIGKFNLGKYFIRLTSCSDLRGNREGSADWFSFWTSATWCIDKILQEIYYMGWPSYWK